MTTTFRRLLRAALDASDGDEVAAATLVLVRCRDQVFRRALLSELAPEIEAAAPTLRGVVAEAEAHAGGDKGRLEHILSERYDGRENPRLVAHVGRTLWLGLARALLTAIYEEKASSPITGTA